MEVDGRRRIVVVVAGGIRCCVRFFLVTLTIFAVAVLFYWSKVQYIFAFMVWLSKLILLRLFRVNPDF